MNCCGFSNPGIAEDELNCKNHRSCVIGSVGAKTFKRFLPHTPSSNILARRPGLAGDPPGVLFLAVVQDFETYMGTNLMRAERFLAVLRRYLGNHAHN
jgi:hypothetical protein